MSSKKMKITCINCGICLERLKRHVILKQNTNVITLIASWISPEIITENDKICTDCWKKAIEVVNENLAWKIIKTEMPDEAVSAEDNGATDLLMSKKVVGHRLVCVICGKSLVKRRHRSIEGPISAEFKVICEQVPRKTVTENDKICHACWLRIKRIAEIKKKEVEASVQYNIEIKVEPQPDETKLSQIKPKVKESDELSESSDREWEPPKSLVSKLSTATPTQINTEGKDNIDLPNYKRAPASKSQCLFKPCTSRSYVSIPDYIRRKLLSDHKYYIPKLSKVCEKHFNENKWDELPFNSGITTFTAEHIEHIFSLINTDSQLDFDDVMNIEDNIFKYLLGMTKDNFSKIINDIPDLKCMNKGEFGLAALIMKYKNNESGAKLSELMGTSRNTLERVTKIVRKIVMLRMADIEKEDQTVPVEQNEPIMFTPQEVSDYFKSFSKDEKPCKKKQGKVAKRVTVYCVEKHNKEVSDSEDNNESDA